MSAELTKARVAFHRRLIEDGVLGIDSKGIVSNADAQQQTSRFLAYHIANTLGVQPGNSRLAGQKAGRLFEEAVQLFVNKTVQLFPMLRPGKWEVENLGSRRGEYHLAHYEPYRHLYDLAQAIEKDSTLGSALGNSYQISPDVIVLRAPETDEVINAEKDLVDSEYGRYAMIRASNNDRQIVHAVLSCKWTLRSDRAQNARSEALNVIRNRKGRTPHILVVTGEPTPSRLSSLALGTGDLDAVYHFALPELISAVEALGSTEVSRTLNTLIDGKRLRDISDLPLDLMV